MRVLFIGSLPEPVTGQSLACKVLLDELQKHATVDVVNLSKATFKQGISSWQRIIEVLAIVFRVWKLQFSADVIYFTISESIAGNAKDLSIYAACFFRLQRMVIHLHGGAGMTRLMRGRFGTLRALNGFFLRRVGAIIVLGERLVDVFAGAQKGTAIHVVPNFAEDFVYCDLSSIEGKFRNLEPLRILYLSNLLPGKGYVELLDAYEMLSNSQQAMISLDYAGGFDSAASEAEFLARIKKHSGIKYHGLVRGWTKKKLLAEAHVFCLPTYYPFEGQPISILEAYASGCVVITTDHSGIFDVFSDGDNGYAVVKGSAIDLKEVLVRMLEGQGNFLSIAKRNRQTASERYTARRYQANLLRIIDSMNKSRVKSPAR